MAVRAHSANPDVLRWARESAGLSREQVAESLDKDPELIQAWEEGDEVPTFRQLQALATRLYKRPIAVFFFPAPPDETPIQRQFRTLPDTDLEALSSDTLYALRQARSWQLALPELTVGINQIAEPLPSRIRATPNANPRALAHAVRDQLGITVNKQQGWRSTDEALKAWRQRLEQEGVYVFKRSFEQKDISGFCLFDPRFPLIVINNSTAHSRQIFTLFHELAHLIFGVSGVTTRHAQDISSLSRDAKAIEVACNRFAAELLLPQEAFPWALFKKAPLDLAISQVAAAFRVSREVVLRRLLDNEYIDSATYSGKVEEWQQDYDRDDQAGGGGSYYANQGTYFSDAFLNAALYQYHAGALSIGDLAERLEMKAQNIPRFEEFLLKRGK